MLHLNVALLGFLQLSDVPFVPVLVKEHLTFPLRESCPHLIDLKFFCLLACLVDLVQGLLKGRPRGWLFDSIIFLFTFLCVQDALRPVVAVFSAIVRLKYTQIVSHFNLIFSVTVVVIELFCRLNSSREGISVSLQSSQSILSGLKIDDLVAFNGFMELGLLFNKLC